MYVYSINHGVCSITTACTNIKNSRDLGTCIKVVTTMMSKELSVLPPSAFLWLLVLAMLPQLGIATQGLTQEATIVTTLQEHVNYGACMARIDPPPSAEMLSPAGTFLDCSTGDSFVTFDCLNTSGQTTKATASQMFQTAQLAMITGKKVQLILDDTFKIDGWCLVRRIDLLP
jgi:hypothetical protein